MTFEYRASGTLFSLTDDLTAETRAYIRVRLSHTFSRAHTLSLLYAPLEVESKGRVEHDVMYNGTTFSAGTPLRGTYQFNSYRLSYRYNVIRLATLEFGLGVTAKIRDANITVSSENSTVDRPSLGLVPLPNFYLRWAYYKDWGLLFEGDAYAGPGGRAIDVQLAATCDLSSSLIVRLGYRLLDGGADNARVYGFARFHYGALGLVSSL